MWRRLILHETEFLREKFFTSYFIDDHVFFRVFTLYIVFVFIELIEYACLNT